MVGQKRKIFFKEEKANIKIYSYFGFASIWFESIQKGVFSEIHI